MPKGKSAEEYKKEARLNSILGIIMLIAFIAALYFCFHFLLNTGIFENK